MEMHRRPRPRTENEPGDLKGHPARHHLAPAHSRSAKKQVRRTTMTTSSPHAAATTNPKPYHSRGRQRLERIPERFRSIPGIEHVTTVRQLRRLYEYLMLDPAARAPFIRLGCSVSHGQARLTNPPTSTWVVTVGNEVRIIHKHGWDPRSAWKWFRNPARPWNIDRVLH